MNRIKLMTRLQGTFITLFFLLMITSLTPLVHAAENTLGNNPAQLVKFVDPILESKVRMELKKPKGGLTALDLSKLTSISASNSITSLVGLEYAINLVDIFVRESLLSDLSPLANLKKLKVVEITTSQIQDLTPLKGLTELEYLSIGGDFISDLTPLKNLSSLKELLLSNNNISDLTPVLSLKNLERLNVDNNYIENLEGVWDLPKLYGLDINSNLIKDLSPLTVLPLLSQLDISYTQVTDISPLQTLGLTIIQLDHTDISDITPLQNIPSLKYIYLYQDPLSEQSKSFLETYKKQTGEIFIDDSYSSSFAEPKVFIDGKIQMFQTHHPLINNGSTLLPLRELFQIFGATVQWDAATRTVTATKGSTHIVLTIDSKTAQINHQDVTLLSPPIILRSHTLIPFRFVAEAFGYSVEWNDKYHWVKIKTLI